MIKMFQLYLLFFLVLYSGSSSAASCIADNATVKQVFQWNDGSIFIVLDKSLVIEGSSPSQECGCSHDYRVGFHKTDDEKFFISAALTALTTGNKVMVKANNGDGICPVHSNTPKLQVFLLKSSH